MVQFIGAIIFMAVMNRIAGVDDFKTGLPGRPLWYITPGVAMAAYVVTDNALVALALTASFVLWRTPSWGYLTTLGYVTPPRAPKLLETRLLQAAQGSYFGALSLRMLLCAPALAVVAYAHADFIYVMLAIPVSLLMAGAFAAAWRLFPQSAIPAADMACGGIWAVIMAASN